MSGDITERLPDDPREPWREEVLTRLERVEQKIDERSRHTAPLRSTLESMRDEFRLEIDGLRAELRAGLDANAQAVAAVGTELGEFRAELRRIIGGLAHTTSQLVQGVAGQTSTELGLLAGRLDELESRVTRLEGRTP